MTAEKKIAQKRLTLLQVAERIRNVSEPADATVSATASFTSTSGLSRSEGLTVSWTDRLFPRASLMKRLPL